MAQKAGSGKTGTRIGRDAAGNEHGVLLGSVPGLPAIILGSHLDTVPSGGLYDGAMGVAAALAAA